MIQEQLSETLKTPVLANSTTASINKFVSDSTDKMIPLIFSPSAPLPPFTIVSVEHFHAKWKVPFDESKTTTAKFRTITGEQKVSESFESVDDAHPPPTRLFT